MNYLKCNHCGQPNELKTEYQVFCQHCGKKMDNNFPSWKEEHPGKTFEDFKDEVCIKESSKPVPHVEKSSRKVHSSRGRVIGILIGIAALFGIGKLTQVIMNEMLTKNLGEYLSTDWTEQHLGVLGLSVESPMKLQQSFDLENSISDATRDKIEVIESYVSKKKTDNLSITANSIQYKYGSAVSLKGAANGSIMELQSRPGVSDFRFEDEAVRYLDIPGVLIKGKWVDNDKVVGFQEVLFVHDTRLWQVIVVFDYTDEYGHKIADKVMNSVKITKDSA